MIIRIFVFICAICISPSVGKMDLTKFTNTFEDMCFQNEPTDPFRVNGQERPLSNTLENFIALAEKFEAAHPTFDLKQELTYFISEYLFENIKFTKGKVDEWKIGRAHLETIDKLWDPDQEEGYRPKGKEDTFTPDEMCSLYHMISHSILKKDDELLKSFSPHNFSSSTGDRSLNPDHYYPQEMGVVAIRGTDAAVQLSKVLLGLYVGLKSNRFTDLSNYEVFQNLKDQPLPEDMTLDALYAVTMADILMQAAWTSDRSGLAPNGKWQSIPLSDSDRKIDGFCPMVYKHETQTQKGPIQAYSYSSVRGAMDGLILGLVASPVYNKKSSVRLSQILRMYYSPDGITSESLIDEVNEKKVSFCNRQALMQRVERKLQDQMLAYGYLIASTPKDVGNILTEAKNLYSTHKNDIFDSSNTVIQNYCHRDYNPEKPENLPKELFLDVIVVLDTSNTVSEASFQEQQLITGYLANHLELRYTGSRMTILLDRKNSSDARNSPKIELTPVVLDTYSSSCAACTVGQLRYDLYETSDLGRDLVIVGLDQFLQERKENETRKSGVNGKVVVYFNYENGDQRQGNNKIQGQLEKALRDFHTRHTDIHFYAVGMDTEILKSYARRDNSLIFKPDTPEKVASELYERMLSTPALLQYADCEEARNEKSYVYENAVSPLTVQHFEMPAEYFYKSKSLSFMFESQQGNIQVCHNRGTKEPENVIKGCKNTTGNAPIEFKLSNPCIRSTKEACSSFYFSVMGMDSNGNLMRPDNRARDYCTDSGEHWCRTLDEIKYKVSHIGVRCSGCLRLNAPSAIVLIAALLTYFVYRKY